MEVSFFPARLGAPEAHTVQKTTRQHVFQDAGGVMTRPGILAVFILCGSSWTGLGQQTLPPPAYETRASVVKIEVHLTNVDDHERVPDQLRRCFEESDFCVIGTGVRINSEGDVLTAAHVAQDTSAVGEALRNAGIDSQVLIAGSARNAEYVRGDAERTGGVAAASMKAIDTEHDLAVLKTQETGDFAAIDDRTRSNRGREAKLDLQRPDPGEAIFGFGFPEYSPGLIATTGAITLAVGSTNLPEAQKSGNTQLVPVYRAGLEIDPGNSGAAVFRASDGALRGIVCEISEKPSIVATIVPASEIAKVLSKYAVRWDAAPDGPPKVKTRAGFRKHLW
ncbi:trypsin-like peptidase domain-containing protein [Acidobacteria bacterium AB60]|nr:trypsin-like peptidase domain-containing protein [Acidobacteria bacterium AB60]